jgi:hypothetical protein
MATKRKPTFAEIVENVRAAPPTKITVRPGGFNADAQFFDPSGSLLNRVQHSISESDAADLVVAGALAVFESCGCGGGGGCIPDWVSDDDLSRLRTAGKPRFVKGYGSPTWIDHWTGDGRDVVFLHGDVEWGDVI